MPLLRNLLTTSISTTTSSESTGTGATSSNDPEQRAFLQSRVASFGLLAGSLSSFFFILTLVDLVIEFDAFVPNLEDVMHAAAIVCFLGVWAVLRSGERSVFAIRRIEEVGLVGGCLCYAVMGMGLDVISNPGLTVTLATSFMLVIRAIYVPSTAWRSCALALPIAVAILITQWHHTSNAPQALWDLHFELDPELTREQALISITANLAAWWVLAIAITSSASRVIYGLRREVRDARRLGQYTLDQQLGSGGMGAVYHAHHAMLRRPTAVKLLPPENWSERAVARFEREVQRTAELTHPNTVTIFDYGRTPEGTFYYAMELLDGATLETIVEARGPLSPARTIHVLEGVAAALVEAHGLGLIHRDIKPSNIMLCRQGGEWDIPKVLDFGLVKEIEPDANDPALTSAEVLTGTPLYMAPECITRPDDLDPRSDLYALGAVAYYLVTGEVVFEGRSAVEVCGHHLHTIPTPPSERIGRSLAPDLEALIMQCLEKEPADRPGSAADFRGALLSCKDSGGWNASDAESWWRENESLLSAPGDVDLVGRTIEIDRAAR